jgi:leucyl/phenylalanyl-tRNA---protein transferase
MNESAPEAWDDWPVQLLDERPIFPPPAAARADGLLAIGGDLSIARLLAAYRQGIFPWYAEGDPILWWSPDPRLILEPDGLKVTRSLRALMRKDRFQVTFDTAFSRVVAACAETPRGDEFATWIHPEIAAAYGALHELGYAHSAESWEAGELVGGLYGVALGRCFFGESMFSWRSNASKVALAALVALLRSRNVHLIDCQVTSAHLLSLGAREIPRDTFLRLLDGSLAHPTSRNRWTRAPGEQAP